MFKLSDSGGEAHRHALQIISFKILMLSPNSSICKILKKLFYVLLLYYVCLTKLPLKGN